MVCSFLNLQAALLLPTGVYAQNGKGEVYGVFVPAASILPSK